ncbi:hypothetical protein V5O48_012416 [Marasmius crinis-equi]|uniref:Uncharacterized protein n=1 Tax=Marasmius crinis-equi TaxID=585013 RepID=A0ABR3F2T2_9AGAR
MSGTYEHRADDYTLNALNTFSFGNAPTSLDPSASSTSSLAPEQDSPIHVDVTPRPSVVGPSHHRDYNLAKTRAGNDGEEKHDHNGDVSKAAISTENSPNPSPSPSQSMSALSYEDRQQVEFSSDDDFGHDYDDDDSDAEFNETSRPGGRGDLEGLTSIAEGHPPSAADLRSWRRGSLPGPTALNVGATSGSSATPPAPENGSYHGRDREASAATLRRPSKSLDNGLRTPTLRDSHSGSSRSSSQRNLKTPAESSNPPIVFSSPFSSDNTTKIKSPPAVPPTQSIDPRTPLPPSQTAPVVSTSLSPTDDLGFDLRYITQGITSFEDSPVSSASTTTAVNSQLNDFVARRPSLTPSTASGTKSPKWWNNWGFPRRHSAVSTTSSGEGGERINGGSMFVYDDSFSKGLVRWGGEGYKEQRKEWCFRRIPDVAKESEGEGGSAGEKAGDDDETQSSAASVAGSGEEKDKEKERKRAKAKDRIRERERRAPEHWRGMGIGAEETWQNDLVGSFSVVREEIVRNASAEPSGKGPQQRLLVRSTRKRPNSENRRRELPHPPVIVHKHSKALAFSLSRYYKAPPTTVTSERTSSSTYTTATSSATYRPSTPTTIGQRSIGGVLSPSMTPQRGTARVILLAPRKVQEAFTSTTTTKMLAEHGLLQGDDDGRGHHGRRKSAVASLPSNLGQSSRRERSKSVSASTPSSSSKGKKKDTSASKDVSIPVPPLPPPPATAPVSTSVQASPSRISSLAPPSPSAPAAIPETSESPAGDLKETSQLTPTTSHSSSSLSSSSQKRPVDAGDDDSYDSQDYEDRDAHPTSSSNYSSSTGETSQDDDTDGLDMDTDDDAPKVVFRTPHRETYGTVDFNSYERLLVQHSSQSESRSALGIFDRLRSRNARPGHGGPFAFEPPWMTFEPRGKQEQQKKVVDNLNMSFKDVGLLPSTPRDRPFNKSQGGKAKRKNGTSTLPPNSALGKGGIRKKRDVFENIPPDSLYMLLPLWPGDTDHNSQRNYPFVRPHVPPEKRKFLLVSYKALDPKENPVNSAESTNSKGTIGKGTTSKAEKSVTSSVATASSRSRGKLSSRISSTSSTDSKPWDDKNVLLPGFRIVARQVSSADLQGSGVRMPEEGLAVSGPLEDAFRHMPFSISDEYHSSLGRRRASWASASEDYHGGALDFVLGTCYSREAGVEFDPEGLVALGLCIVLNPLPKGTVAEEWSDQGTKMHQVKLTPIGMAVMEMAWIGGMALTSFGPC